MSRVQDGGAQSAVMEHHGAGTDGIQNTFGPLAIRPLEPAVGKGGVRLVLARRPVKPPWAEDAGQMPKPGPWTRGNSDATILRICLPIFFFVPGRFYQTAGSCWLRQWKLPSPQIISVESSPITLRSGKHS